MTKVRLSLPGCLSGIRNAALRLKAGCCCEAHTGQKAGCFQWVLEEGGMLGMNPIHLNMPMSFLRLWLSGTSQISPVSDQVGVSQHL